MDIRKKGLFITEVSEESLTQGPNNKRILALLIGEFVVIGAGLTYCFIVLIDRFTANVRALICAGIMVLYTTLSVLMFLSVQNIMVIDIHGITVKRKIGSSSDLTWAQVTKIRRVNGERNIELFEISYGAKKPLFLRRTQEIGEALAKYYSGNIE